MPAVDLSKHFGRKSDVGKEGVERKVQHHHRETAGRRSMADDPKVVVHIHTAVGTDNYLCLEINLVDPGMSRWKHQRLKTYFSDVSRHIPTIRACTNRCF